jgi:N-acetyl-anhydromuramyl-L-alanine amidase AmpD
MKPVDVLLLSFAIGLTAFTVHVFSDAPPPSAPAPEALTRAPANPAFRSVVLHHSATHGGSAAAFERNHRTRLGGLAYHFVIGNGSGRPDGTVEIGYRWRDQLTAPHTKNAEANRESIAVCLVGDFQSKGPTVRQAQALIDLLTRLCREYKIPAERVRSHREVDAETLCPGKGLDMDALRQALRVRLAPAALEGGLTAAPR